MRPKPSVRGRTTPQREGNGPVPRPDRTRATAPRDTDGRVRGTARAPARPAERFSAPDASLICYRYGSLPSGGQFPRRPRFSGSDTAATGPNGTPSTGGRTARPSCRPRPGRDTDLRPPRAREQASTVRHGAHDRSAHPGTGTRTGAGAPQDPGTAGLEQRRGDPCVCVCVLASFLLRWPVGVCTVVMCCLLVVVVARPLRGIGPARAREEEAWSGLAAIWLLLMALSPAIEQASRVLPEPQNALGPRHRVRDPADDPQEPSGGTALLRGRHHDQRVDLPVPTERFRTPRRAGPAGPGPRLRPGPFLRPGGADGLRQVHPGEGADQSGRGPQGHGTRRRHRPARPGPGGSAGMGGGRPATRRDPRRAPHGERRAVRRPGPRDPGRPAGAGTAAWVASLPDGIHPRLGDGGRTLSAGQEQPVAFARLLVRNPRVIVLDEATARTDPLTERRMHRAAGRLLHGRTGIVIAHRPSTVGDLDEVVVLAEGRVIEAGPIGEPHRSARLLRAGRAPAERSGPGRSGPDPGPPGATVALPASSDGEFVPGTGTALRDRERPAVLTAVEGPPGARRPPDGRKPFLHARPRAVPGKRPAGSPSHPERPLGPGRSPRVPVPCGRSSG